METTSALRDDDDDVLGDCITTTTTSTTPSHRVGWPSLGGCIPGKPRVSHDFSFRANLAFAVTTISASKENDNDILEDSTTNTNIATTKAIK